MKFLALKPLLLFSFLVAVCAQAALQGGRWEPVHIESANISVITFHPTYAGLVFAGNDEGFLYSSTDGGKNWSALLEALRAARRILIDPSEPQIIYAVFDGEIDRSEDGGHYFDYADNGIPSSGNSVNDAALIPGQVDRLIAVTDHGFFQTLNRGQSWELLNSAWDAEPLDVIVAAPGDPQRLYAATGGSCKMSCGILSSSNGGQTWSRVNSRRANTAMAVSPTNPNHVFALQGRCLSGPEAGDCGVFRSTDGGHNFVRSGFPSEPRAIAIDPSNSNTVYVVTNQLWRSNNSGQSWQVVQAPIADSQPLTVTVDPQDSSTLLESLVGRGIFRTGDGGANWERSRAGLVEFLVEDIEAVPSKPGRILVSGGGSLGGVISRSDDYGITWETLLTTRVRLEHVKASPTDPEHYFAAERKRLYFSQNAGATWQVCPEPEVLNFFIGDLLLARDGTLYLALSFAEGILKSSDDCQTWEEAGLQGQTLNVLVQHPSQDATFLAGSYDALSRTTNGGVEWTPLREGIFTDVSINPLNPNEIFARAGQGNALRSADGGASWSEFAVEDAGRTYTVAFDPVDPARRYLMGLDGVLVSRDGGLTWNYQDDGIYSGLNDRMLVDPTDPFHLYVRSSGGLYRYPERRWLFGAGNSDGRRFDGFAFSNYSERDGLIRLSEVGPMAPAGSMSARPAGQTLKTLELAAGRQQASLRPDLFPGSAEDPGWFEFQSDSPTAAFFQFGTADLSQLDGGVSIGVSTRRFYFRRVIAGSGIFRGQNATTRFSLYNPYSETAEIIFRYRPAGRLEDRPAGAELEADSSLAGHQAQHFLATDLFGVNTLQGYVEVEVLQGPEIIGFELIELPDRHTVLGLNAAIEHWDPQLYSAQLADSPAVFTEVSLINISKRTQRGTLSVIGNDGSVLSEPVQLELAAGEQVVFDAGETFPLQAPQGGGVLEGSLEVKLEEPGSMIGGVIFGDPLNVRFAAALPLQSYPFEEAVYSQVANIPGFFTGLAFFNPVGGEEPLGTGTATVEIIVFRPSGEEAGRTQIQLLAGQRTSRLVPDFVPGTEQLPGGYVQIFASEGVISQMLFGATDQSGIRLFSAVPPEVVY